MPNETNSGRLEYVYDFYEYSEKDGKISFTAKEIINSADLTAV